MSILKRLCVAITLTILLAGTALADCPVPGEVSSPPCTLSQQLTEESAGEATTSETASVTNAIEDVVLDVVLGGLANLLTVY